MIISRVFSNLTRRKVVCGINQLTCQVAANPVPLYNWFDITNSVDIRLASENQTFSLAENHRTYKIARLYNYIRGSKNVISSTYSVTDSQGSTACSKCLAYNTKSVYCKTEIRILQLE